MTKAFTKAFNFTTFILLNPVKVAKFRLLGYESHFKFIIFMLNLFYVFFSLILSISTFETLTIKFNIGITLQFTQTITPTLIMVYLALDSLREKKISHCLKVSEKLLKNNKVAVRLCQLRLLSRLLVLIVVRGLKLSQSYGFVNIAYALCTMFPELVISMSDYAFAFYVEILTLDIKKFNSWLMMNTISSKNMKSIEEKLEKFHNLSREITAIYSSRLIVTILFNFVQLVIALYWIFIRIWFNYMNVATFFYVVQPLLCLYTLCNSAQSLLNEVKY